jgi:hypothetical protein
MDPVKAKRFAELDNKYTIQNKTIEKIYREIKT